MSMTETGKKLTGILLAAVLSVSDTLGTWAQTAQIGETEKGMDEGSISVSQGLIDELLGAGPYASGEVILTVNEAFTDDWSGDFVYLAEVDRRHILQAVSEDSADRQEDTGLEYEAFVRDRLEEEKNRSQDSFQILLIQDPEKTTGDLLGMFYADPQVIMAEPNYYANTVVEDQDGKQAAKTESEAQAAETENDARAAASENGNEIPADAAETEADTQAAASGSAFDLSFLQWYAQSSEPSVYATPSAPLHAGYSLNVPDWNTDQENASGTICVMDSGIDTTHPDLESVLYTFTKEQQEKYDCGPHGVNVNTRSLSDEMPAESEETYRKDISDHLMHGTHIAGMIGAAWDRKGVSGIANGIRLLAVRLNENDGRGQGASDVLKGFEWLCRVAEEVNLKAVNVSLGSMQPQLTSETCSKALKNRNYTFSGEYAKSSKGIAGFAAYLYNTAQEISKEQYGYYTPVSVCGEINMLAGTELSDDKNEYSFSNIVNNDCEEYYFNEVRFDSEVFEATKYAKKSFSEACADVFGQVSRALKPVLISGVHSSGVNSVYSQNAVTETEQGNRLVAAVSAAKDAGCLGAAVCDLNDSWTDVSDDMKSSVAENNAMWHNTCDPAQTTGLIAMDAAQPDTPGLVLSDDDLVEGISMCSNAEYMYITLQLYEEIDFKSNAMFVGIDTYQRNDGEYYYAKDFTPNSLSGMEFVLRFDGKQNAALYVIKSYDRTKGTAYTEESYSADFKKVSDLVYGGFSTGDTQFYQTGSTVYVRLPWNWLNVADPSKQLVINDKDGRSERFKTVTTNGALVSVMIGARKDGDLIYGFPADKHDPGYKVFRWSKWDTVSYNLRQKESFGLLKKYFEK